MKRLVICFSFLCVLLSCVRENVTLRDRFLDEGGIYAVRGGEVLFAFNENTCQWSYSPATRVFMIFDDNLSDWLRLDCKGARLAEGDTFSASLEWTTRTDLQSLKNVTFQLMKIADGVYYFWSSSQNIALRLRGE